MPPSDPLFAFEDVVVEVGGATILDGVTAQIPEREIRMHLLDVEKAAREVMSRMNPGPPPLHPYVD